MERLLAILKRLPTCRLTFRPTAQMKLDSNWYPAEELKEAGEWEKEQEANFVAYLEGLEKEAE